METTTIHTYDVALNWENKTNNGIATSGVRSPLLFGPPPEFGGSENTWSPEHLLAASVASCYTTTFLHFAKLLKVSLMNFSITCTVEFTKQEIGFEATRFNLKPIVKLQHNPGQNIIDSLFAKAKKYCFVSNSVKGEIVVDPILLNI